MRPAPFHRGERALQETLGLVERMDAIGRKVIRPFMPDQHRALFMKLPMILISHLDDRGRAWASVLGGPAGFVESPDPARLRIAAAPNPGDPLSGSLEPGLEVGLLGLEIPTRRRNRANGRISHVSDGAFSIDIRESFGNCPKYIDNWDWEPVEHHAFPAPEPFTGLVGEAADLISQATAFFVSSAGPGPADQASVDLSHRGGEPGFVQVEGGRLLIPDYSGNRFFNTLGNLLENPSAGLTFMDPVPGDILQLTGRAEVHIDGMERHWTFTPDEGQWLRRSLPVTHADGRAG